MPGDPFKQAQAGQPLDISADAWNAVVASARDARRFGTQGGSAGVPTLAPGECYVENTTGQNLDQFSVVGISGAILTPDTNADGFAERAAVTGVKPTSDHEDGKFAVLVEPIANGLVARAVIGGSTVCKINVTDDTHKFAKAKADTTAALVSADAGPCVILWKQPGTGDGKWAVVRFGGGAAAGVKWGKLTTLWVPGDNYVKLQPVKDAAGTAFDSPVPPVVNVFIISPINKKPAYLLGEVNDVFPYEDKGGGAVFLVNPQTTPIPVKQFEVIQNQGTSPTAPQWVADIMQGHNLP